MSSLFSFPNPVNEYAARATAGLVVALALVVLVTNHWIGYLILAVGFLLRVAAGPRFSPFGRIAVHLIAPRLGYKATPGPPKRFAQTVGLVFSTSALALCLSGYSLAAQLVIGALIIAASLESFAGICLGCIGFGYLQRAGLIPQSICEECAAVSFTQHFSSAPKTEPTDTFTNHDLLK